MNQARQETEFGDKWFEYHCYEGEDSVDAELWRHTHQRVQTQRQLGTDEVDEETVGRMFRVKFQDGYEHDVFEDELMDSPSEFCRPDYPYTDERS